jgi:hypothetical protein
MFEGMTCGCLDLGSPAYKVLGQVREVVDEVERL